MKVFHLFFIVALLALTFFGLQYRIEQVRQEAISEASERLELTRDIRIAQLNSELKTIYSEIRFWADSKLLIDGMEEILIGWNDLSVNPKAKARQLYITENPLHPNYTADFYKADDGSIYSENHEKLHRLLKGLTQQRGYYDVFLIANNGDIVYTVYKEDDYATNLLTGKYKDTTLAKGFREVIDNTNLNHVSLFDFIPYAPSNNASSSFIQASIIDRNNKPQGMLAFQLPTESIDAILSNVSGRGGLTEIFAVGSDHLLRNRIDNVVIKEKLQSEAIDKTLNGESGVDQLTDYKGVATLTAYAPFHFSQDVLGETDKNTWAIIVKQEIDEILGPVEREMKKWLILLAGLAILSLIMAWVLSIKSKEDLRTTEE